MDQDRTHTLEYRHESALSKRCGEIVAHQIASEQTRSDHRKDQKVFDRSYQHPPCLFDARTR
jgi:hypothetical protein